MSYISGGALLLIWLVLTIACLVIYHKCFNVYYFNLGKGLFKEILVAGFVSLILIACFLVLWWLTAIILAFVTLYAIGRTENPTTKKVILVIGIVAIIIVSIAGINLKNKQNEEANNNEIENVSYCLDSIRKEPSYGCNKGIYLLSHNRKPFRVVLEGNFNV